MDTNIFHNAVKNLTSGKEWRCLTIPDSEKYFLDHFEIVSIDKNRQAQYSNDPSDFGFTWDELVIETKRLEAEYEANSYQRDRASQFPEVKEQLDLLFHDMTSGKGNKNGNWYKAVNKVKTDNPKPE